MELWLRDRLVARTVVGDRGRKVRVTYEPDVLAEIPDEATPIGTKRLLQTVDRAALLDEARAMGLAAAVAEAALDGLAVDVAAAMDGLPDDVTRDWPADGVMGIISSRLERLASGLPLGASPRSPTTRRTLDQATLELS